jgi:hypothetical protein
MEVSWAVWCLVSTATVTVQGSPCRPTRLARVGDFYLATSGDLDMATSGDSFMAMDIPAAGSTVTLTSGHTVPSAYDVSGRRTQFHPPEGAPDRGA